MKPEGGFSSLYASAHQPGHDPGPGLVGSATVKVPGTCGELVQGILDGSHFLITCPVAMYSTARVDLYRGDGDVTGPKDCPKAVEAVRLTLERLGREDLRACLHISSSLPRGKGMASSTADVAAAIGATAQALGTALSPVEVGQLALLVEPSDGVMFPGIALFDHRGGRVYEALGEPPPIEIVVMDFGGVVDTLEFNSGDISGLRSSLGAGIGEAVGYVRRGVREGDPALVGNGATISALANQSVLCKPQLQDVLDFSNDMGGVGVNAAHSGTVLGVLLDSRKGRGRRVYQEALKAFPQLEAVYLLPVVGGGSLLIERAGDSAH